MNLSAFEKQAINPRDAQHLIDHWRKNAEASIAASDDKTRTEKENHYRKMYGTYFLNAAKALAASSTLDDTKVLRELYGQAREKFIEDGRCNYPGIYYGQTDALGYIILELDRLIKVLNK